MNEGCLWAALWLLHCFMNDIVREYLHLDYVHVMKFGN